MEINFVKKVEFTTEPFLKLKERILKICPDVDTNGVKQVVIIADNFLKQDINLEELVNDLSIDLYTYDLNTEPSTEYIDNLKEKLLINRNGLIPHLIVGIGGGSVMDSTKALSNILTNPGKSESYQGWDLVVRPGVYKIGIPTLFGTGAETSRTCVLLNKAKNLKLGMNSNYSIFDELIISPNFLSSAPNSILILTALDGFFHVSEILDGKNRNSITDSLAEKSLEHFTKFVDNNSREDFTDLALSSFYGGIALSGGVVGLIHPFSAALSVVFGFPHNLANCLAMKGLTKFYPKRSDLFWRVVSKYNLTEIIACGKVLSEIELERLYQSTIIHSKPLENHLGSNWRGILTRDVVFALFTEILQ
jgi:3-deoxy-alpha-D-manno-octulosonate 8-oxidase